RLIREEIAELCKAVKEKDYIETVDALADIIYVVLGMGARIGINMDAILNGDSNLSYSLNDTPLQRSAFRQVVKSFVPLKPNKETLDMVNLAEINRLMENLEYAVIEKNYSQMVHFLNMILQQAYLICGSIGTDMDLAFDLVHN